MKLFSSIKYGFDSIALRAFISVNQRREYLWFSLMVGVMAMYVMYYVLTAGYEIRTGLMHLLQGGWLPLVSLVVFFAAWPKIKPGASKPNINDRYIAVVAALVMIGSWYLLGGSIAMVLIVAACVLSVLFASTFGLNRLMMAPFVFGILSPFAMGVADNPTNMLVATIDRSLVALTIPVRGWDEALAMMCLILVVYSPLHVAMQQRGSTVYYQRRDDRAHEVDFITQPNIVRVGGVWLATHGAIVAIACLRKMRAIIARLFNKGRVAAKESIQNKKMDRLQKRTDADLAAAGAAAFARQQEVDMSAVVFGEVTEETNGFEFESDRGFDSFIDLKAEDYFESPPSGSDSPYVPGEVVHS